MPAATTTQIGKGAKLGYSTATGASPYTYTYLATVVSVAPNFTTNEVENKILATQWLGYLPTNVEGEADYTIQHIPGDPGTAEMVSLALTPAVIHWQILFPDGISAIAFDGYLKSYNITFENDSIIEAECSLRINTAPVFTTS